MEYGECPVCGEYGKLPEPDDTPPESGFISLHCCRPKFMCSLDNNVAPKAIYAYTCRDAAEKYAEWYDKQYSKDSFDIGNAVTVIANNGIKFRYVIMSANIRVYKAITEPEEIDKLKKEK